METSSTPSAEGPPEETVKPIGCAHYKRKSKFVCVENVSRSNCPVCLEDIHTSRVICHVPPCGHLLHRPCFERMLKFGLYACPVCQTSLVNMERLWKYWDEEVENTPMPEEYRNCYVGILCKDCHKEGTVKFHVVGFKCSHCGSYNTCRVRGPVIRNFERNLENMHINENQGESSNEENNEAAAEGSDRNEDEDPRPSTTGN
ncbi:unnamed protein product [Callosobruchus maculatus]|uniref:RING-type domain-containing protein n=1 Tax=Callosobruchus maculatus TaxID=64391 RepID=A0A653BPH4_CALMS|nr:unnamed protein product [Callosobruchus maculatus]